MERSRVSLPTFITGYHGSGINCSKGFQALVRGIGEAKSKNEEDRIIKAEFAVLKEKLSQQSSSKQMREYLIRLIYCEMLGIDASDLHIHAINFAQQRNLHDKRIGYLALSIFLHENHSLILLLINTLQRDLTSTNVLEVCYALTAINKLINAEMIPAILKYVLDLTNNKRDIIRKKAIMALHTLYQKSPSMIPDVLDIATNGLKDKDLSVSSASLILLYDLVVVDPASHKHLIPVLVSLQQKIISGKLQQDFDYHRVPAPWIQIKLLRILSLLGAYDLKASKNIYEVLGKTLSYLNTSSLIAYAVAYECARTIATIYPDERLVKQAAKVVGLFLVAKSNNIKYLGINALAALVEVKASFATEPAYQRIIIDCLDDPDETLKRKTLDLLCRITNADNVESICDRLIKYLRNTVDVYFKTDLVARVTELAERYAPDNSWYIVTMNEVLELGGELVREEVAHNLMRLIAEGNEDEDAEEELRRFSVLSYIDLIEKPVLPEILVQVISWVLGEYSYTVPELEPESVIDKLCCLLDRNYTDPSTKRWIVTSIGKILSQTSSSQMPNKIQQILTSATSDIDILQRCHEIEMLSKNSSLMRKVLPEDASCEDIEVDSSLSFLDDYVTKALQQGASPYLPEDQRGNDETTIKMKEIKAEDPKLKLTPYNFPKPPIKEPRPRPVTIEIDEPKPKPNTATYTKRRVLEEPTTLKAISGVQGPWGPKGYSKGLGSGSGESESMSGSSSRSSGSERLPVLTSKSEISPSPLVFTHEDKSKQRLVNDLFKGVGDKAQVPGRKGTAARGTGRATRSTPRKKIPDISDPGHPPVPPPRKYLEKNTMATNEVDLLLSLDNDSQSPRTDTNESVSEGLVTTGDNFNELLYDSENTATVIPLMTERTDKDICKESSSDALPPGNDILKVELVTDDGNPEKGEVHEDLPDMKEQEDSRELLIEHQSALDLGPKSSDMNPIESLIDSDISEDVNRLALNEESVSALTVPDELKDYPTSRDKIDLSSDANIRVTLQKVYKPDELVLVVFLTNQSKGNLPVTNVVTSLNPPSNLRASFDSSSDNRFVDEEIKPLSSVTHVLALQYKSPALHMTLGGKVTYKDSTNTLKTMFISHVLPIRDLMRPLTIDTDGFGDKWSETPFEKRQKVDSMVKSCEEFLGRVEEGLGLNAIDTIGSKAIAAGTVLQGPVCLLHGMVNSNGALDLRIKTNSQLLSEAVIQQCLAILK
ncbi:AP-4 complex subunit epsilon-like [Actinia tenebrosa]|uniref:AP-4 complex subunit epsilon-like n=1 Tax=Actinia tenebrosa TaxID=6105 RepID=A0A6P8IL25_ACTTE|nr:AP-4 complex subunit epsilon-like [Actinia tenebrosa]